MHGLGGAGIEIERESRGLVAGGQTRRILEDAAHLQPDLLRAAVPEVGHDLEPAGGIDALRPAGAGDGPLRRTVQQLELPGVLEGILGALLREKVAGPLWPPANSRRRRSETGNFMGCGARSGPPWWGKVRLSRHVFGATSP